MRIAVGIRQLLPITALLLPLCGCEALGSLAGQLIDRASTELAGDTAQAGNDNTDGGVTPGTDAQGGSGGNVYFQYVDDSGSVRFVRDRSQIPTKFRANAGRLEIESRPATTTTASTTPRRSIWKDAAEAPWSGGGPGEVVMYTAPWCGVCRKADAYFRSEGIAYTPKDIEANEAYKRELVKKTGRASVPVIEIGDERMVGWDQRRVARLLKP